MFYIYRITDLYRWDMWHWQLSPYRENAYLIELSGIQCIKHYFPTIRLHAVGKNSLWFTIVFFNSFYFTTQNYYMKSIRKRGFQYKKRLLLICIHHFKSDLINNMDHMRISDNEPSSVVLSQRSNFKSWKEMSQTCQNKLKSKRMKSFNLFNNIRWSILLVLNAYILSWTIFIETLSPFLSSLT